VDFAKTAEVAALEVLDFDTVVYQLLLPALRGDEVLKPNIEVADGQETLPFITYRVNPGAAVDDGGDTPPTAWYADLDLSIFGVGRAATFAIASRLYAHVHRWNDPWGIPPVGSVEGLGHATEVRDRSAPSVITQTTLQGVQLVQMATGFSLQLHKA
jgi:hypothetical protein